MQEAVQEKSPTLPGRHLIRTIFIVLAVLVVYAFAVQATNISLERPLDPGRQENVLRVLRLLADPDLVTVDEATGRITPSEASIITVEHIIETIFMALLASTAGMFLAVPVSFLAARNLMEPVTAPLAAIMAGIIALPIGGWLTLQGSRQVWQLSESIGAISPAVALAALVAALGALWLLWRAGASAAVEEGATRRQTLVFALRALLAIFLVLLALGLLALLAQTSGAWMERNLGPFGFVGNFLAISGQFMRVFFPPIIALTGALLAASYGSRYGQEAVIKLGTQPAKILTAGLTAVGSGLTVFAIGSALNWLYQFDNPQNWTIYPALIAGVAAGLLSLLAAPKKPFGIGMVIYSISRGILNVLRSIEPLIMAIVFVVWVSLGPFAGILALTLHSIAALGKLFSEQIEGIDNGPVEAITSTGANRLQTIVYAVVPQVVPPFTAFALYRWDINVRMSTIIGFVGGGGIGFVLSQNIQLLRYRQASVMMLAIAIVVILLDYASSRIRRRII